MYLEKQKMKIVNLIENTSGNNTACLAEHGLSYYIETGDCRILVDTGASDAFAENAKLLGVNLEKVDLAVLSHGHYDHAGGLLTFAGINSKAPVYMRKTAAGAFYHGERYIGIDPEILKLPQVQLLEADVCLKKNALWLFGGVTGRKLWPQGNLQLKVKRSGTEHAEADAEQKNISYVQDEFDHEQYLVVKEKEKRVLFSGCAHNGILNILEHYKKLFGGEPDAVFSGFHMRQKEGYQESDLVTIKEIAKELRSWKTKFYTGHCTGDLPFALMKEIMGDQLEYVHSGDKVVL